MGTNATPLQQAPQPAPQPVLQSTPPPATTTTTTSTKPVGLYEKIGRVMETIGYLQKDGRVNMRNNGGYNYLSETKITSEVKKAMIQHGLIMFPHKCEEKKDGTLTRVTMTYKIVDRQTGEFDFIETAGHGADTQDKGASKAQTMAFKYAQRQTFMIPSGDDPDQIGSDDLTQQMQQARDMQYNQIGQLMTQLNWTRERTAEFAGQTCGNNDLGTFDFGMLQMLVSGMQNELIKMTQPQNQQLANQQIASTGPTPI